MTSDPRWVAFCAVEKMMNEGLKKHQQHVWRTEPHFNHVGKGIRHGITHQLIAEGNQPPDGESHLENAITRYAFALCQVIDKEKDNAE